MMDNGVSHSRGWRGTFCRFDDLLPTELYMMVWANDDTIFSEETGGVSTSIPGPSNNICKKDLKKGTTESASEVEVKDPEKCLCPTYLFVGS